MVPYARSRVNILKIVKVAMTILVRLAIVGAAINAPVEWMIKAFNMVREKEDSRTASIVDLMITANQIGVKGASIVDLVIVT